MGYFAAFVAGYFVGGLVTFALFWVMDGVSRSKQAGRDLDCQ
jgi:hypothetical protein